MDAGLDEPDSPAIQSFFEFSTGNEIIVLNHNSEKISVCYTFL